MTFARACVAGGRAPVGADLQSWSETLTPWLGWLFALGIGSLLLTILFVPIVVVRLPADHFIAPRTSRPPRSAAAWLGHAGKNVLGAILVLAGIAMMLLPGQGLLTILVGLLLLDFPGKRRLELALVRRRAVRRFLDRMRQKRGREPFRLEP